MLSQHCWHSNQLDGDQHNVFMRTSLNWANTNRQFSQNYSFILKGTSQQIISLHIFHNLDPFCSLPHYWTKETNFPIKVMKKRHHALIGLKMAPYLINLNRFFNYFERFIFWELDCEGAEETALRPDETENGSKTSLRRGENADTGEENSYILTSRSKWLLYKKCMLTSHKSKVDFTSQFVIQLLFFVFIIKNIMNNSCTWNICEDSIF